jgi:hypothetical protein
MEPPPRLHSSTAPESASRHDQCTRTTSPSTATTGGGGEVELGEAASLEEAAAATKGRGAESWWRRRGAAAAALRGAAEAAAAAATRAPGRTGAAAGAGAARLLLVDAAALLRARRSEEELICLIGSGCRSRSRGCVCGDGGSVVFSDARASARPIAGDGRDNAQSEIEGEIDACGGSRGLEARRFLKGKGAKNAPALDADAVSAS